MILNVRVREEGREGAVEGGKRGGAIPMYLVARAKIGFNGRIV